jgi:hypothetical protein
MESSCTCLVITAAGSSVYRLPGDYRLSLLSSEVGPVPHLQVEVFQEWELGQDLDDLAEVL